MERRERQVLLLVETSRRFGRGLLEGVSRYRRDVGGWSVSVDERGIAEGLTGFVREWRGDGILLRARDVRVVREVAGLGLPVVCLGEVLDSGLPTVHTDDAVVGKIGAEHLMGLGFRALGYLGVAGVGCSAAREAAFREAVACGGGCCSAKRLPSRTASFDLRTEDGMAILAWLSGLEKPCGVMVYYDLLAVRLLELCRGAGIRVPGDVAILGVGDDPTFCEFSDPPLSSVQHDLPRIGYEGARLLDRMMSGEGTDGAPIWVAPVGVTRRGSTDCAAGADPQMVRALKCIEDRACSGIGVDDVIRAAGASRRTFSARFRRLAGVGPKEAISRAQFRRVQELLRTTDYKLAHIAEECGFEHMEHMAAAFKRRFGVTPGGYRARHRRPGAGVVRATDGDRGGGAAKGGQRRRGRV